MTRFCIRCTEAHSDDSPVCSACSYSEPPAPDTCWKCRSNLIDGECPECREYALKHGLLGLTDVKRLGPGKIAA